MQVVQLRLLEPVVFGPRGLPGCVTARAGSLVLTAEECWESDAVAFYVWSVDETDPEDPQHAAWILRDQVVGPID